ncbi:zinc knuckle-domain-containing protein [Mycena crocata]|nr:zinc knuckle-domain-containing protein [Mycena crocata]
MSRYAPHGPSNRARATQSTICQKCLKTGHFIYECKAPRPYVSRPSRTQQLENPSVLAKLKAAGKPSVEVPEEFKKKDGTANRILEAKEKERENAVKGKGKEKETKKARRCVHMLSQRIPNVYLSNSHLKQLVVFHRLGLGL